MRSDNRHPWTGNAWNGTRARQFYRMPPRPCPYIQGHVEQNVFTELSGPDSEMYYGVLARAGFRRSHGIAYRPSCPGCTACMPVRVVVDDFKPGKTLRRIRNRNSDLEMESHAPVATREQYRLFSRYLMSRHGEGEMAAMMFEDYEAMVADTPLDTSVIEFRDPDGVLGAACLADRLPDGLSAVYSFFEPSAVRRGLGNHVVMALIEAARAEGLPYVYLGYWIPNSAKMAYKAKFRPLEGMGPDGWEPLQLLSA